MKTVIIPIEGMMCNHCVASVTSALTALDGVSEANVSLESQSAEVTFDESKCQETAICDIIEELGFSVKK